MSRVWQILRHNSEKKRNARLKFQILHQKHQLKTKGVTLGLWLTAQQQNLKILHVR